MQTTNTQSRPARITGYVLSTLATLFLLMDAGMKIVCPPFVISSSAPLGYSSIETLRIIGAVLLVFTILYVIPRTSVFGAILITAYLGGAVEANVRVGQPAFNLAFPMLFAVILWLGLWLRNLRLRTLVPLANTAEAQREAQTSQRATTSPSV